jgi:chemotaxis signal transduction protein
MNTDTSAGAIARLVEYAPDRWVALPVHVTLEVLENPEPVLVPGAAAHACGLLAWQGKQLPMIDLGVLVHPDAHPSGDASRYALVVAFQPAPGMPVKQGALRTLELPRTIEVGDDEACDLPTDSALWPHLARSCFQRDGRVVPIVDTARLFAPPPSSKV